jgi:hypothetical protein
MYQNYIQFNLFSFLASIAYFDTKQYDQSLN